jgi:copper(I)-binding protein
VVVCVGDTEREPLTATAPMPLFMVADSALVELQVSVEDPSGWILAGLADRLTVGAGVVTVTVAVAVAVVPPPVTVMVYVVVCVGDTEREPFSATVPIPLSMLAEVAFVEVQERVEVTPEWMLVGFAERLTVGAGGVTVTVAVSVAVPPGPVTVMVYVVVVSGVTEREPFTATVPMPLSMLAEVASVDVQVSVDDPPDWMLAGFADRFTVGSIVTVTVAVASAIPPGPVTVMV